MLYFQDDMYRRHAKSDGIATSEECGYVGEDLIDKLVDKCERLTKHI